MMMLNSNVTVFLLDDELPKDERFRREGVYNSAISSDNLYHLAVNLEWNDLANLQQLVKDIISCDAFREGHIDFVGFTSPSQALVAIEKGLIPDVVIYDWEYVNSPAYHSSSTEWLLDIFSSTKAFVFVYSKMRDQLPTYLNNNQFATFASRFQLLLKGGGIESSFSAEEFILQYIIGLAAKSGKIKISGVEIEFTANDYLAHASDILYLQRILGRKYVLDELKNIDFAFNTAGVEKILNDFNGHLYFSNDKQMLINPDEVVLVTKIGTDRLERISYVDAVKKYSIYKLEEALEKGIAIV